MAALSDADRALCDFAVRLTRVPSAVTAADVDGLRAHGFRDDQITVAVQVIGYFNYINRVAEGLGVDAEAWMTPTRADWLAQRDRDDGGDRD